MEMLALMHEAEPIGHLLVSGRPPTDAQLAMLVGTLPDQIPDLLGELESAGVFSRTQKGAIYSRRMTRDDKKARVARKNGKSGGNPTLCNETEISASDNPPLKAGDNTQKPEARSQIDKKGSSLRSDMREAEGEFAEFWEAFPNKVGKPIAKAKHAIARRKASHAEIMAGLSRYIDDKPPDRAWLHPSTFLHNERWADQPAPISPIGANGHGRQSSTAFGNLIEGAFREVERREHERQADRRTDSGFAFPLLDSK